LDIFTLTIAMTEITLKINQDTPLIEIIDRKQAHFADDSLRLKQHLFKIAQQAIAFESARLLSSDNFSALTIEIANEVIQSLEQIKPKAS